MSVNETTWHPAQEGSSTEGAQAFMKTPRHMREGFLFAGTTSKADADIHFHIRTPQEVESQRPVLIVGGFGGRESYYARFRDALAAVLHRPVATAERPRHEKHLLSRLSPAKILHPEKLGFQAVVAMIDALSARFKAEVTVIGHSMGGVEVVEATLRRLGLVDQLVLLGSGGLEAGQSRQRLANRAPAIARDEIAPALFCLMNRNPFDFAFSTAALVLDNPWRTAAEAAHVSSRPLMEDELGNLALHKVETDAIQLANDRFFPLEEARRSAAHLVNGFHVLEGGYHMWPITHPDHVAGFVGSVISANTNQLATV